jgi:hypothetical protein
MSMEKCPKCCKDNLTYVGDNCTGEIEDWHCMSCDTFYEVDVEIKRDFNNMREVQYES